MKNKIRYWIVLLGMPLFLLCSGKAYAGPGDFQLSVRDITQPAPNRIEFNVYLLDTDPDNDFYFSTGQLGILFNSAIYAGGSLTVSIDNTNSDLSSSLRFPGPPAVETDANYAGQTHIKLIGVLPSIPLAQCALISKVSPGTLLTHFVLTNTENFVSGTTPDFVFTSSSDLTPFLATSVVVSDGTLTSPLIVTPGANAIVVGNPVLNAPPPQPGTISGSAVQCSGVTGQIYSVGEVATATSYNWTLPTGWAITSGSGTNAVTVTIGTSGGTVGVTASNAGGVSPASTLDVTVNQTPVVADQTPVSISSDEAFTVTPVGVPTGTTYTWPAPTMSVGVTGGVAQSSGSPNITGTLSIPSGNGTAIYTVTPANGTCVGNTFTVTVNVSSSCVPVQITTEPVNASMCAGGSASFNLTADGTSPVYQWQYNNGGTWANVLNDTPSGAVYSNAATATLGVSGITAAGAYDYRCSITNCGGSNNAVSSAATLTVNTIPTITGTTPGSNCGPGTVTLVASASAGTINWYSASSGGTSLFTGTSFTTPSLSATTTYYVDATNNGCTTATRTPIIATINTVPTITGTTPASRCGPGTVTLGAVASAGTINWYSASTGGTSLFTGASFTTPSISATTTYYVDATNNGCTTATRTPVIATINIVPTITGTTPASRCGPGTVTLGAVASAGTINWYSASSGGTSLFTGTSFTTPSLSATTTYYVDATNNGCTTATRTEVIATVNPLPTTSAITGSLTPACSSTSNVYSVTATTGSSYAWTVPAGSIITAGAGTNSITVTFGTTSGNVTVTETNASGCAGTPQSLAVTLQGCGLDADFSAAPLTVCIGSAVTFTNISTGTSTSTTYSWNFGAGANPATGTGAGPHAVTYSTSGSKTVSLTITEGATNIETKTNYITVNPLPTTSAITGSLTPACSSTGNVYSVTATTGSSYAWTVPAGSIITAGAGTNSITVTFGTTSGNVTVTETNAAGCEGAARTLYASLLGCGLDADFVGNPRTLCAGSQVLFANTSMGTTSNTSFAWNFGEGANPATAATAGPHTVTYSTGGAKTVSLTITEGATNTETKTGYITVNPLPGAAGTITGPASVCVGQTGVTYTVPAIPNATSYSWNYSGSGATITGTTNSITMSFGASALSGTLTVRGTNSCGTGTTSAGYVITVNPVPSAPTVGAITQPTCSVATGNVVLGGLPAGSWTLNPGSITGSTPTVTVTGLAAGSHTFTVTNANGCTSVASLPVVITTPPAVPTAPVMGTVTQPTCAVTTGSVGISGLPSTGNWTLTRNPGGNTVTGTGTTYTLSGIPAGTYTYTVTNLAGCVSPASASITVNAPLPVPAVPVQTVNCDGGFNHAVITVSSPTGAGLEYRLNSGAWQTSNIFNDVANGSHTITVRNSSGCTTTGEQFSVNCGCINPPLLTLGATAGSTCGITAVTVSGNTFGGSATSVTITEDGGGTVTPASSTASPFAFTYTPTAADAGRTVVITVTTNNPLGSPCAATSATYTLTVNALPTAPVRGTITHPTCELPTGSVVLNSLPASGDWTITRTPGGQTTTGSGTSTTITGLAPGTYSFTVTNANGCVSASSSNVVINAQPDTPAAPVAGVITQPTCALSTGSVALSGLPATGTWTLTRMPGNVPITGTGTTRTVSAIPPGTYTFTVANAAGCASPASAEVVINPQPVTPTAPLIGTITHPTCELATGSIVLEYLPEAGEWTLIRYPGASSSTGTGSSVTISALPAGTYNFVVRNADGCSSAVSTSAVINTQPATPTAPVVGAITHPTFQVGTGSVVLSGLPSSGTWTLIRYPDGFTSQGTGTTRTVSGLEPGTYTFAVTNTAGCTSLPTADVVVNARPGAPNIVINNPPTICENQTTDLTLPAVTAGSDPNLTFSYWTDAAATVPLAAPQAAPAGSYYIMGTSTAEYFTIKPVVVTADELPVANAGPDQVLDYLFGTTLNAEIPEIGTGIWELVSGTGNLFDATDESTLVSGLSAGENVFSWTVTNGACDPVTDEMVVRVNNLTIPTLITPNEDGRNDFFEIRGLETLGRTEITIFDRRGMEVYENDDYSNEQGNRWEGLDYNSNPLPEDTYFYVIRAANGVSISGYIVVRR